MPSFGLPYIPPDGKTCLRCGNKKGSKIRCGHWGTNFPRHLFK